MKKIFMFAVLVFLVSCAKPLPYTNFLPNDNFYSALPKNEKLIGNIKIGKITLDKDIHNFLDAPGFQNALASALLEANFKEYGFKPAIYVLDAHVTEVDMPFIGFNYNVTSKIQYTLRDKSTGGVLLSEFVTIKHEVGYFEELNGAQRVVKAFSGSIKNNIAHFVRVLSTKTKL